MIDNFNNIYLFLLFAFGCVLTPGFYAYQLWEAKGIFRRYNIDESATLVQRFAAAWPKQQLFFTDWHSNYLFWHLQGNWAFFTLGLIVFIANLIYNTGVLF